MEKEEFEYYRKMKLDKNHKSFIQDKRYEVGDIVTINPSMRDYYKSDLHYNFGCNNGMTDMCGEQYKIRLVLDKNTSAPLLKLSSVGGEVEESWNWSIEMFLESYSVPKYCALSDGCVYILRCGKTVAYNKTTGTLMSNDGLNILATGYNGMNHKNMSALDIIGEV